MGMRSPAGLELLARPRIAGWPSFATPWRTLSMKLGSGAVPNLGLNTSMHLGPHCGVAALAESVPAALAPPTTVSAAAAAASTLLLTDMGSSIGGSQACPVHAAELAAL